MTPRSANVVASAEGALDSSVGVSMGVSWSTLSRPLLAIVLHRVGPATNAQRPNEVTAREICR
jgi:hypothetical protein